MWWLLHVPSIFANGFCMVLKKKFLGAAEVSKSTFSKAWSWRKKTISVSSCASNYVSKRRYQPWLRAMRGVRGGRLNWSRFSTMVWSPSCYPNTNKQRRNIGVNDRGGGWRRVRRRAVRSIAPEPWKVKDRCVLRTLPDPAPDGTPTPFLSLLQTSSPCSTSFSAKLSAWLHEKFHGLGTWKTFQRRFIGARRLCSYGGLLTYSGTFGSQSLG